MNFVACALSLVLAVQGAPPAAASPKCELTDSRCKAELFVRRAAQATTSPADRAKYLLAAYRLYLHLYDKTGDEQDLCAARRYFEQSVASQPDSEGASYASERAALTAREQARRPRCAAEAKQRTAPKRPLVARAKAPATSKTAEEAAVAPLMAEPDTAAPSTALASPSSTPTPNVMASASADDLLPVTGRSSPRRPQPAGRPTLTAEGPPAATRDHGPAAPGGRSLMIAGGVTMTAGLVLGGVAGYSGAVAILAKQDGEALVSRPLAAGSPELDKDAALREEYERRGNLAIATGVAGGAALLASAVLFAVGARRAARAASPTALLPAPGGFVLRARF